MCLAVPGKIIEMTSLTPMKMGKVDFGGVMREVCLEAVPEAKLGNYVIVHAGFALNILSEQEALDSLQTFQELDDFENQIMSPEKDTF